MLELFQIMDKAENENVKIEVLQYNKLGGSRSIDQAGNLYFAEKAGLKLKQVKITLKKGGVMTEAGALHFMKGNLSMQTGGGNGSASAAGFMRRLATSMVTNESMSKPLYTGQGEIYLEPSFGHYIILQIEQDQLIADKGLFYCCESTIEIGAERMRNLSSAIAGGEGLFQVKLSGSGICVLEIPVPAEELMVMDLNNEKLQVDGNFALFRTGDIQFTVEKSSKSILGSITSGEGLLQTFTGTGQVFLAPTLSAYGVNRINPTSST